MQTAKRCGGCRYCKVEEAGRGNRAFLRCMAPGKWHGRVLLLTNRDYTESQADNLVTPAWCKHT